MLCKERANADRDGGCHGRETQDPAPPHAESGQASHSTTTRGVDCRVRNLSPVGACLEVASQIGIPDEFVLVVEIDHVKAPCHVIWRTATRLGVEFNA